MSSLRVDSVHLRARLASLEEYLARWLDRWSVTILRVGLGAIFLGFGFLKFFPGFSPAEGLVIQTLDVMSLGLVPARAGVVMVAVLECAIGLGLITGKFLRLALLMLGFQMLGAMSPLVLFPGELFGGPMHAPTLEGQYVLKDVILVSAGLVIGTTLLKGGVGTGKSSVSVGASLRHETSGQSNFSDRVPSLAGAENGVVRDRED